MRCFAQTLLVALVIAMSAAGCGNEAAMRRTVREVGPDKLRTESLAACHEGFKAGMAQKVPEERWPDSVRAFHPLGLWAEPDGAYILLDSDAGGERGVFLPRILSDKDPLCGPTLTHVKLAEGVYSYERKR
jgi:hypothetical protein